VDDGQNLEERLRTARFAALPAAVATGHTMDDQAETVLANLLRAAASTGWRAWPGTRAPDPGPPSGRDEGAVRHPRARRLRGPTNDDPRHLRNRIRAELLPLCAEISGRDPVPILARTAALAGDDCEVLDDAADLAVPDPTDAHLLSAAAVPWHGGRSAGGSGTWAQPHHHRARLGPSPSLRRRRRRVLDVAAGGAVPPR